MAHTMESESLGGSNSRNDPHDNHMQRPRSAAEKLALGQKLAVKRQDIMNELTPAQRRVLVHLLAGFSESQIVAELNISKHTVHDHIKAMYRKLHIKARTQLILLFAHEGL